MKKQLSKLIPSIIIPVLLIWYFLPRFLTEFYCTIEEKGAYGDMYGSANALFTALAFAGVIITLIFQLKELELTRNELSGQRQELANQKEQLEIQNKTFKKQQFENTFFSLLRINIDIVSALEIVEGGQVRYAGKTCLSLQKRMLHGYIKDGLSINESFNRLFEKDQPHLGHYFRQLYHIIKFIDDEGSDRMRYANFMKAQLNNDELVLIAYNGASVHGENFRHLIERYGLLENITEGTLFSEDDARNYYDERAFGK